MSRAGGRGRFGSGVVAMPLWLRVVVTAPFVVLGLPLLLVFAQTVPDPYAAFWFMGLLFVGYPAAVLLPQVWLPTQESVKDRHRSAQLERRLAQELRHDTAPFGAGPRAHPRRW